VYEVTKAIPFPWIPPPNNIIEKSVYLAIDPGETSGYALFDNEGKELYIGQFTQDKQTEALSTLIHSNLKEVICEDYRNHGWQQQKRWSRNQTSKNIGAIEILCDLRGIRIELQSNTVKTIGYKWAGMPGPPSNHNISHQYDALAHGVHRLVSLGIRNPSIAIPESDL
jgi:hypothetical protein